MTSQQPDDEKSVKTCTECPGRRFGGSPSGLAG